MSDTQDNCPKCSSPHGYSDRNLMICPECAHEWDPVAPSAEEATDAGLAVRDANGTLLRDGDTVVLVKDLKVKGSPVDLKIGTRVKDIRLVEGDHQIDCKIKDFGGMKLKAEFVRKA